MITEEQRKERRNYIGSSDAGAVLGLSPYETPLSIWSEKTGQYLKPEIESEAAELGKELENYVSKRFERKTGKRVIDSPETFYHPQYSFLAANIDRLIDGEDAILEAKTCSAWKARDWQGEEIPLHYILQVYHQLMVTGKKKAYICVLIGNSEFKWKEILRDEKVISSMLDKEVYFWKEYVEKNVMPGMIKRQDTDVLFGLFPEAIEGKAIKLSDDANIIIENLQANKQDLKNLENVIEENENQLKALLGDAEVGQTSLYKVHWSNIKSKRWDTKALEESHPELVSQFKPEKLSRRFSYKSLKGE